LLALMAAPATARDAPAARPPAEPIERRPYAIRAILVVDPQTRLDARSVEILTADWMKLVRRFVGAPWKFEVVPATGRFAAVPPAELQPDDFAPLREGLDKLWVIRLAPGPGRGYRLSGREYDTLTGTLGTVASRDVPAPADAPRALFEFSRTLFTPTAEVVSALGDTVRLTVQGSLLGAADGVGQVVAPGTVFVPLRIFQRPDQAVSKILPIGWTYLKVRSIEPPTAQCTLITGLPDPLSRRVVGSYRLVAVGVKPGDEPSRFRFETRPPDPRPAAGYTVVVREAPDGPPREVGSTDREGRFVLPGGFSRGPIIVRLLAGGVEPLVEFPILPGETTEERVIRVNPRARTIALETRLAALKDEVLDLVAVRARLEARLKARLEGGALDEVQPLLDEFHRLTPRRSFEDRLARLRDEATEQQDQLKIPILTRTARAQLDEAEALITRYLDDEMFQAYESAYRDIQAGGVLTPSADWQAFAPPGDAFSVQIPGTPTATGGQLATGAGNLPLRLWSSKHQERTYAVGYADPPAGTPPLDLAASREGLGKLRDQLLANNPGFRLLDEKPLNQGDLAGLDLRLTSREGGAESRVHRQRFLVAPSGRTYVQIYVGPANSAESREAELFFNSFRPQGAAQAKAARAVPTGPASATPGTPAAQPRPTAPAPAAPKPRTAPPAVNPF
jgi:hypothetical protein